jgi:hypothetical protein
MSHLIAGTLVETYPRNRGITALHNRLHFTGRQDSNTLPKPIPQQANAERDRFIMADLSRLQTARPAKSVRGR